MELPRLKPIRNKSLIKQRNNELKDLMKRFNVQQTQVFINKLTKKKQLYLKLPLLTELETNPTTYAQTTKNVHKQMHNKSINKDRTR